MIIEGDSIYTVILLLTKHFIQTAGCAGTVNTYLAQSIVCIVERHIFHTGER